MLTATENGVVFDENQEPVCAHNWYYDNAFFFAGTVVTTIGKLSDKQLRMWELLFLVLFTRHCVL